MSLPAQTVTLDVAQIEELSQHFSFFRHDVNNSVGMIGAAAELVRYSPSAAQRWGATVIEQPPRIAGKTREFVMEVRRILGLRKRDEPSWYRDLWRRSNAAPSDVPAPVSLEPESVKALYLELVQLHKEISLLAFAVSGMEAPPNRDAMPEMAAGAAEQTAKVARKFNQFADMLEQKLGVTSIQHRLLTGVPASPVTLSPEQIALLDRRLTNLEQDIQGHLEPLLELSRVARTTPDQLQARVPDLASYAPRISAEIQKFSSDFDVTFGIQRAN
jgi:hypothetical protein